MNLFLVLAIMYLIGAIGAIDYGNKKVSDYYHADGSAVSSGESWGIYIFAFFWPFCVVFAIIWTFVDMAERRQ